MAPKNKKNNPPQKKESSFGNLVVGTGLILLLLLISAGSTGSGSVSYPYSGRIIYVKKRGDKFAFFDGDERELTLDLAVAWAKDCFQIRGNEETTTFKESDALETIFAPKPVLFLTPAQLPFFMR